MFNDVGIIVLHPFLNNISSLETEDCCSLAVVAILLPIVVRDKS